MTANTHSTSNKSKEVTLGEYLYVATKHESKVYVGRLVLFLICSLVEGLVEGSAKSYIYPYREDNAKLDELAEN